MPIFEIQPGETQRVINEGDDTSYYAQLFGAPVELGTTQYRAEEKGQKRPAGDSGDLDAGGTPLYAHNPTSANVAELRLLLNDPSEEEGVNWDRDPRDTIAAVQGEDGGEAAPRSDAYLERQNRQVPVEANGSVVEAFRVPARADWVCIAVDDADGPHAVAVEFCDSDLNEIVTFDRTHSDDYVGDPASDDYVAVPTRVFSVHVRVTIHDTSGAMNRLDYSIYGR